MTKLKAWRGFALVLVVILALGVVLGAHMLEEPSPASASGVAATDVSLTGQIPANDYTYVQFDIAWNNSWRIEGGNWDAVWIFVKYQLSGSSEWNHAHLNTTASNHRLNGTPLPTGDLACAAASDGTGVFLYRASPGTGDVSWTDVELRWDYGTDSLADDAIVRVKVFAIEMVYIPQASFYVGDADNDQANCFHDGDDTGPYHVTSEGAITVGTGDGQLYYDQDNGWAGDRGTPIPGAFPKGYDAFYCMKYEISHRQYAEFLNTLTQPQQETRTRDTLSSEDAAGHYVMIGEDITAVTDRQCIKAGSNPADGQPYTFGCDLDGDGNLNETNDGQWIACGFLSWGDSAAHADWAGLRPCSELEFEKICRGDEGVVDDEYAWGNANVASSAYTLSNPGEAAEAIHTNYASEPIGNTLRWSTAGSIDGPVRCGIFADSDSTRAEAGASYYGVMEMSGNLWEQVVTVGNGTGRSFTGSHGDGALTSVGEANVGDWPGSDGVGRGFRGGGWVDSGDCQRVSDRIVANYIPDEPPHSWNCHLARTP